MTERILKAIPLWGSTSDSLGGYLMGLGVLKVSARRWPNVRGCWRDGVFVLMGGAQSADELSDYFLTSYKPSEYERRWVEEQKKDTKRFSSQVQKKRSQAAESHLPVFDSHIATVGKNHFNPLWGTGGNIGKRMLDNVARSCSKEINEAGEIVRRGWLDYSLFGVATNLPREVKGAGTWFVSANKTFNSGQADFHREGQISPWSYLLAVEGGLLLAGGSGRRLGSRARHYAVFPFIAPNPSPVREKEVGSVKGEFWAPLWSQPLNLPELVELIALGRARVGKQSAEAPHEFALAALGRGVDSGVAAFQRFSLEQTTSQQTFEAVPRGTFVVRANCEALRDANLLGSLLPWLRNLPFEPSSAKSKQRFSGLRGPVELALIDVSAEPERAEHWQALLQVVARTQARVDRNKDLRETCIPLPRLDIAWFDRLFRNEPISEEVRLAAAIASISSTGDVPSILGNIFGVDCNPNGEPLFPTIRPARAVWNDGVFAGELIRVLDRRLVDASETDVVPIKGGYGCPLRIVLNFIAGRLDDEEVGRWLPMLVLLNWRQPLPEVLERQEHTSFTVLSEADGSGLFYALLKALFHPGTVYLSRDEPLFPNDRPPRPSTARQLMAALQQGDTELVVRQASNRYHAGGRRVVGVTFSTESDLLTRVAAALLVPIGHSDVSACVKRWLLNQKWKGEQIR